MSESFKLNTNEIKKTLQTATFTASKEKDNILSNALIKIDNDTLTIISQNAITKSIQKLKIEETNIKTTLLINPNTMFNIFKELKEEETEITIEDNTIKIKNGKFSTTIKTLNKELYPEETIEETQEITKIPSDKIKHLFKSTTPYPDKNDISREYTGIYVEIKKDKLKASATDHFRLINVITENENLENETSFILENDGANIISKIEMDETIKLEKGKNIILLKDLNKTIISKTIEGTFPDYESILLDNTSNKVTLERNALLGSIKRVSITNQNNEIIINITPTQKTLIVQSINQEGEESKDEIAIIESNNDNEISIKLDSRFTINFLSQVNTENVEFYYRSNEEPIMIKAKEKDYIYNYIMTPIVE